ncbi:oligosaccharide flippase family protein, partial [Vibrio splendidus]|uniref:oligosaccharide flippase family protein n=1 Tax=Vibrio splendidus TaxID=29497 RepID=UPI000C83A855
MPNLLKNFFSLGSVQVSGYLLTLVTMPYLIKTIGIEEFGVIVFSQTLVSYFIILIDYGFSITATKEISENRKNKGRINEIVSTVISIKIAIFTLGFLLYLLVLSIISPEEERLLIYIVTYFMGLSNVFFPVYYFQGVEKMHYTAIFNILPKVVVLCSVFVFVKSPADTLVVAIITSLGFAISGVTSLVYSIHLGVRYVKPSLQQCLLSVKDARSVFVGMLSSNISSNSIVLFLGIFTSSSIVGTYSAVEKFVKPVSFFSNTLLQVIYPRMVDMKKNNLNYMSFCLKLSVVYLILLTLALLVYYFALNY